jgi:hypothetical protein
LVAEFGSAIFAYVCNVPEDRADDFVAGTYELSASQTNVIRQVLDLLFQVRMQALEIGIPPHLNLASMIQQVRPTGINVLNAFRMEAGGDLPILESSDSVVGPLCELAADAFPMLILGEHAGRRDALMSSSIPLLSSFGHPARAQFEAAVLADPELGMYFPIRGNDAASTTGVVFDSTGRGMTLQLVGFAGVVLSAAYALTRMRGPLVPRALRAALHDVVDIMRRTARGHATTVPVFVGFNNVAIPQGSPVELPWGSIRSITEADFEFVPTEARPSTLAEPSVLLGFVLETTARYELRILEEFPQEPGNRPVPLRRSQEGVSELDRRCDLTSLAFVLGIVRRPPIAPIRSWTTMFNPFSLGANTSWRGRVMPPLEFYQADVTQVQTVQEWLARIQSVDDSKIRIAQRRILSSITQRLDPLDGYVDAVIAWENLFGGESELGFRISMAMASLLASSLDERLELQNEINSEYSRRSRVVHGADPPPLEESIQHRDRALELALGALRRIYRDFPGLIPLQARDRTRRILLSP